MTETPLPYRALFVRLLTCRCERKPFVSKQIALSGYRPLNVDSSPEATVMGSPRRGYKKAEFGFRCPWVQASRLSKGQL